MATAAELLANGLGHDDTTLVIDNYLRTIHIPKRITNLGVEYDDDVLRLNFKMPRYLDDTDLSTFSIRINYVNANGDGDIYTVSDKVVNPDFITFSWLVGPTATAYKGKTKFNVCMKIVDEDGNVQREYNTAIASLPVLEGLEVDEQVAAMYSDLIEQWKRELFGIGDTEEASMRAVSQEEQENIAQKGAEVLATIPEKYQETANAAQEGIRTKADAIVCAAEGNVIAVSDSSDDHIRGLRVFGKTTQVSTTGTNLFNPYAEQNNSFGNATVENNGARITVTGTYYVSWPLVLKAGVTYYINYTTVGNVTNRAVRFEYADKEITGTVTNPAQFTPTKDTVSVYLYAGLGTEGTIVYENVQISEGNSPIPWEPYSGGVASPSPEWPQEMVSLGDDGIIDVGVTGKNLLPYPYETETTTISGVTITVNVDGTIRLNGTATAGIWFPLKQGFKLPAGAYAVKVLPDDWDDAWGYVIWNGVGGYFNEFKNVFVETTTCDMSITLYNGATLNDVVLKPQIEAGSTFTEYESPKTQTLSVSTHNGLPGIPVTSGGNYTDANGQQWVCNEADVERGVYVQRVGTAIFDGSTDEIWHDELVLNNTVMFRIQISDSVNVGNIVGKDYLCSNFPVKNMYNSDVEGTQHTMQQFYFRIAKSALATVDQDGFRAYLENSPMTVQYVLATPVETALTAEELAAYKALRTNYPNTTVFNDAGAWMELSYNADTKTYVENGIKKTVAEVMEAIENGSY